MPERNLFQVLIVLSAVVRLICSCTPGPVTGTETGNPDISACVASALLLFDTVDAWLPSEYLVDGERQPSPQNVYASPSVEAVAKRMAADTSGGAVRPPGRTCGMTPCSSSIRYFTGIRLSLIPWHSIRSPKCPTSIYQSTNSWCGRYGTILFSSPIRRWFATPF